MLNQRKAWLRDCILWRLTKESMKMRGKPVSGRAILVLCLASFLAGSLFTSRTWTWSSIHDHSQPQISIIPQLESVTQDCDHKRVSLLLLQILSHQFKQFQSICINTKLNLNI